MHPQPKKTGQRGWRERFAALRYLPPLLKLVWETNHWLTLSSILLRLVASVLPLTTLWVGKLIVDAVVRGIQTHQPGPLWRLLALELALAITSDLLGRVISLSDSLLGDQFTNVVSLRLMEHAQKLDLVSFEDPEFYDKLERARRQTTGRLGMVAALAGFVQQMITLASLSVSIIYLSPWFLLLLVAALIPVLWGETHFAMLSYSLLYRWTPERRELDYLRLLGASNASAKEVKIFGLGSYFIEQSRRLFDKFYGENKGIAIKRALTGAALNLLPTATYYGAYALIAARALSGTLSVGSVTFLVAAFGRSRGLLESLFNQFSSISEQALYLEDLFDFFATQPAIVSPPHALPAPRPIRHGFEFRDVSFRYPGAKKDVLSRVSFTFEAGERIALIGENGAGKTTLVKLLARLYDPTEGQILLDGIDLRKYDVEDLRREVGVIFQDYMRYDMRVRENIGLGRVEALEDTGRIETAAQKGYATPLIESLTGGFEQLLGRRFEGGTDLSTGQWQKIALARAYMRDAQVLILDEPTAALDARAEFEVFQRFTELTRDKMAVLISHRFSTVRMADRILVLEEGRILEQGSHVQLLSRQGRYAELFELQAAGYR